jgi:thiol-disulfide isomerase/thioredoxin
MLYISLENIKDEHDLSKHIKTHCKSSDLIVLQFSAVWCQPCKTIKKLIENDNSYKNVQFFYIDIEKNPELTSSNYFQINSVPAFYFGKFVKSDSNKSEIYDFQISETIIRGANYSELKSTINGLI